ncbi:MAG: hypothetical protein OHK0039_22090 [Bacteroidia bacterium]
MGMHKYIALLRGINVSGQKLIRMADLRQHCEAAGLQEVETYIQSGNIIFAADAGMTDELARRIEQLLVAHHGFEVRTLVFTPGDLAGVLAGNPFLQDPDKDLARTYVTFLESHPTPEALARLDGVDYSPEAYVLSGRYLYFIRPRATVAPR